MLSDDLNIHKTLMSFANIETIKKGKNLIDNVSYIQSSKSYNDYIKIRSEVISSDGFTEYQQNLTVSHGYAYGYCTCPVEEGCKHSVAVLYKYLTEESIEDNIENDIKRETKLNVNRNTFFNWIDNFTSEVEDSKPKKKKTSSNYILIYRVVPIEKSVRDIYFQKLTSSTTVSFNPDYENSFIENSRISLNRSRILKNGSLGKESSIKLHKASTPQYLEGLDLEIYSYMQSLRFSGYLTYYKTDNYIKHSEVLLEKLIETERLFYGSESETPLTFTDQKEDLGFIWEEFNLDKFKHLNLDDKKYLYLNYSMRDGLVPLFGFNKLYYINVLENSIGEIGNISFSSKDILKLLNNIPLIEKNDLKEFSSQVEEKLPILPPVIENNEELILDIDPEPYLTLKESGTFLSFAYREKVVEHNNKSLYIELDNRSKLKRVLSKESTLIDRLKMFGFNENESDNSFIMGEDSDSPIEIEKWAEFYDSGIQQLKSEGWIVNIQKSAEFNFKEIESSDIEFDIDESADGNKWFSMELSIDIDGRKLKLAPIVEHFIGTLKSSNLDDGSPSVYIPTGESREFIKVDRKSVQPIINTVLKLYNRESGNIEVDSHEVHDIELSEELQKRFEERHKEIFKLQQRLKEFKQIAPVEPPKSLNAELREYQQEGLNWLSFLREYKFGGILADDMGLGKTIQTLTFLQKEKDEGRLTKPVLIVVPTSLLGNWRRESEKFTPNLTLKIMHRKDRKAVYKQLIADEVHYDILMTTYGLIMRDLKDLLELNFYYIILDEAQKVKNPKAKVSQNLKLIKSDYRLCLTGTPMENHLGELWSLFSFLMPNFLYSEELFNRLYRNPIEKDESVEAQDRLKHRIKPFILRRNKRDVATELPPKTEIVQRVTFDNKQAKLYESIRVTMEKKVQKVINEKGLAKSQIAILDALLKLRQVCCDPRLLKMDEAKDIKESAKLDALFDLLEELLEENRKVILFSQFTSMLELIEDRLLKDSVDYAKLTGSTRDRDSEIEKFKSGNSDLFLVSLKAGGVGLNLTEADTVIIYDPWWNPAVENQAIDRAYRIGQDKKVFVYRFIIEGSVEEKIIELQEKKKLLSESVLSENREGYTITQDDIKDLFAPLKEK